MILTTFFKLCLFVVVVGYAFDKIHEAQTVIWNLVTSKITYNTNHVVTITTKPKRDLLFKWLEFIVCESYFYFFYEKKLSCSKINHRSPSAENDTK